MARSMLATIASSLLLAACASGSNVDSASTIVSTTATTRPVTGATKTPAALYVHGAVSLPPGQTGKLAVIAIGPEDAAGLTPIALRNNTSRTVYNVGANGTADRNGAPVTSLGTAVLSPTVVRSGEWAFGAISFSGDSMSPVERVRITPIADLTPASVVDTPDLKIAMVHDAHAAGNDAIVGTVINPTHMTLTTTPPPLVSLLCFSESGLGSFWLGIVKQARDLAPGAAAPFSIPVKTGSCSGTYAIAAQGVTR